MSVSDSEEALTGFLHRIQELTEHICQNQDEWREKEKQLEIERQYRNELKQVLEELELTICRISTENMVMSLREKKMTHNLRIANEQLTNIREKTNCLSTQRQNLQKKLDHTKKMRANEMSKWEQYIEQSIRCEAESSRFQLSTRTQTIDLLTNEYNQLATTIRKKQEDVELLQMEKILQQEEYSGLTNQWKLKQNEIVSLNSQLLVMNQEYTKLRQKQLHVQQERNRKKDVQRRQELDRFDKQLQGPVQSFKTAAQEIREQEWN